MEIWDSIWDVLWTFFGIFAFVAYLIALFSVITDLFRDQQTSGVKKAIWLIFLVFLPFLTALAYLITRGDGMARRRAEAIREQQHAAEEYVRGLVPAAAASPSEEIAKAKALLDAGTLSQAEYEALKAKALA